MAAILPKSVKSPRDLFVDGNSTREITRKLDHFAGSFSSAPSKSIPVDSIIATRSSKGIAGVSITGGGYSDVCARVKDKINKRERTRETPSRKGNDLVFSDG